MTAELSRIAGQGGNAAPWRPVQYLGAKSRALTYIRAAVESLIPAGGTVWEPFAGSTVVSQALAASGHRVVAGDALTASATFATALLGVGRGAEHRLGSLGPLAEEAVRVAESLEASGADDCWKLWLRRETAALADGDGARLLAVGTDLPQRWRPGGADDRLRALFEQVEHAAQVEVVHPVGLFSATYAGTYFGLQQSLSLENLRAAIDHVAPAARIESAWPRACLLTALSHAASAAVFSPGKHFAQSHRVRDGKNLGFHAKRALEDRSVDIDTAFLRAIEAIDAASRPAGETHIAQRMLVEQVTVEDIKRWNVDVVYADPPYTAQQYSRFYHILETLITGAPSKLQTVRGAVTRGLYPENKYLSPFCSRVKAPGAVSDLVQKSATAGASVVLSYSNCRSGSTGNARSVSLSTLVRAVTETFGTNNVEVEELPFRYRQFNNSSSEVSGRDDAEYLVVGRR